MSTLSRPRVLFVIGTMGGGGAERQIVEILKRLDRTRFEPFLYLAMKQGELLGEVPADVPIFAFWYGSPETVGRKFFRWIKLTRLMRYVHLARLLHMLKIDVIYDRTYLATLDAAGGCMLRPTPRISCCVVDPQPELELHARFSRALSWWFARRAYANASVVLANSEGLRRRVIDYFQLAPAQVKVFYNLLSGAQGEPRSDDRQRLKSAGSADDAVRSVTETSTTSSRMRRPFVIVTAGRLHPQKGQRFLLEAIDDLVNQQGRSIKLFVYGQGESENELREFVRSHQLADQVTFAGFVSDLRAEYQQADLFVLPSLYEGMPNALIEAVALGIPALSTDCPSGPSEIFDEGHCGRLVPPGNSRALADAIADAMDHPDEWQLRSVIAQKRVQELFNPEIGIQRLESLIEQIARVSDASLD